METACRDFLANVDALVDGELEPAEARRLEEHPASCGTCRAEREARRSLKDALSALRLPPAPRRLTLADLAPVRRWRWTAAAAAVLVAALVLLSLPAPLPEVVALSVQFHDDYLRGKISPRGLTPKEIGLQVSVPGADFVGQCACPSELGHSSPFIVFRKGETPISLLVAETEPRDLPAAARRAVGGCEFYLFRAGSDRVLVCQSGRLCHVWVARLEEEELVRTILATNFGRRLFSGERFTLKGIS